MPEWVRVAAAAAFPPGEKMAVAVAGEEIALFNVDGTLYAIGDICTHAEASLAEGEFYDEIVECPLHGSPFDVTTGGPGVAGDGQRGQVCREGRRGRRLRRSGADHAARHALTRACVRRGLDAASVLG